MAFLFANSPRLERLLITVVVVIAGLLVAVRLSTFAVLWYSHHAR